MLSRLRFGFALSTLLACLLAASTAFGRAGGGEGYSGGGGGGGGGGGFSGSGGGDGGGDGGALVYFLIRLCIEHPAIGIPLVILIVAFLYYANRSAVQTHQVRTIRRAAPWIDDRRRQACVAELQKHDPAFDEQAFYNRVGDALLKIQQAWSQQDLRSVQSFLSDGVAERFSLQFQEQRARGFRNLMENVAVLEVALAEVQTTPHDEVAIVRVRAAAVDYRATPAGEYLEGDRSRQEFVEFWSFLRRQGAQTKLGQKGLIEGACPNCGADLELNQHAQCPACGSLLRSGAHDWVLVEITQESEWRPAHAENVLGLQHYRTADDPQLSLPTLEDRASVIFWRKAAADLQGDVAPLRKMAVEGFCTEYAAELRPNGEGFRFFQGDCAVGSVEVLALLPATAQVDDAAPRDRCLLEIRWAGKHFQRTPEGRLVVQQRAALHRTLMVLGRNPGVTTNLDLGLSSAHCPACGAPESNKVSNACDYCGAVLNTGERDWVLLALQPMTSPEAKALLDAARAQPAIPTAELVEPGVPPEGTALLAWLISTGLADKQIDAHERRILLDIAARHHFTTAQFETLLAAVESGEVETPTPQSRDQARDWLLAAADVSLADGRVLRSEYDLLCSASRAFGYSPADVKLLLKRRRTELYQQAKAALRNPV